MLLVHVNSEWKTRLTREKPVFLMTANDSGVIMVKIKLMCIIIDPKFPLGITEVYNYMREIVIAGNLGRLTDVKL